MYMENKYLLYFTFYCFIDSAYGACQMLGDDTLFTTYGPYNKTYTVVAAERDLPRGKSINLAETAMSQPQPDKDTVIDEKPRQVEKPTVQEVFDKFFTKNTFRDKCISKHNQDFWKFKSSTSVITREDRSKSDDKPTFTRQFSRGEEGTYSYSTSGIFSLELGKPYISWSAKGGIPEYKQHETTGGRIYILDIQNVKDENDKSVKSLLTYYSCFEGSDFINDNIYISQTEVSYKGEEVPYEDAFNMAKAKLLDQQKKGTSGQNKDMKAWTVECY